MKAEEKVVSVSSDDERAALDALGAAAAKVLSQAIARLERHEAGTAREIQEACEMGARLQLVLRGNELLIQLCGPNTTMDLSQITHVGFDTTVAH